MLCLMSFRFRLLAMIPSCLLLLTFYKTTIWIYLCLALLTMQRFGRRSLHLRMLSSCLLRRHLVPLVPVGAVLYPHWPLLRATPVLVGAVQYPPPDSSRPGGSPAAPQQPAAPCDPLGRFGVVYTRRPHQQLAVSSGRFSQVYVRRPQLPDQAADPPRRLPSPPPVRRPIHGPIPVRSATV